MKFILAAVLAFSAFGAYASDWVVGEVKKVDDKRGKLVLRHGEVKHLDMPPMTMAFKLANGLKLESFTEGQKIRFKVEKVDGSYTITDASPAP